MMDERGRVLEFASRLVTPESRAAELRKFCAPEKLDAILLFIFDPEVGAYLSAPGFPQTLPNARRWREILAAPSTDPAQNVMVPWPTANELKPAAVISSDGCVLVIVGGAREELTAAFGAALPLLGAALKGERAMLSEAAQTKLANDTARQAHELALGLDKAKRDAQRELAFRRVAEEQVRKRTAVLETLNRAGAALAAELNLERIIRIVTEAGTNIARSEFGAFLGLAPQPAGENFTLRGVVGPRSEVFATLATPMMLETLGQAIQQGKALLNPDLLQFADNSANAWTARSFLAAPVIAPNGDFLGGLVFGHSQSGVFTDDAVEVIVGLASAAGIAMGNAALYEALKLELDEHRRAQAELKLIRDELERRVKERTASLEQAMVQMEEFSYSVSHDLRAPLRAMTGYAEALLADHSAQLDETGRLYLDRIKRASMRMERLTFDLLAYSRVAQMEMPTVLIQPAEVIKELLEHHSSLQEPAATVGIDGELPTLLAHESAFGQVLTNLLTNAVKFVPEGKHPIVTITGETRSPFGRITVADNGIGISPADQARLFQMFERIAPKKNFEGNGIGLAIVRKAVEKMGGRVGVESDGLNGSSFWIELPLAEGGVPKCDGNECLGSGLTAAT